MTGALSLAWPAGTGASRFAPTPTGDLHLGNARTALLAWLAARSTGRRAILRVEDLDPSATPPGCIDAQLDDLAWLGLAWDEGLREGGPHGPYQQSLRADRFAQALQSLNQRGLLYPCWCSRREVLAATRAPHASDEGPVYPGTHRPEKPIEIEDLDHIPPVDGRAPALRLNVLATLDHLGWQTVDFEDVLAGPQQVDLAALGDFVVRRVDGIAAYQVACAVDDALMGCDLVVRGADLLPSAARQILILSALGLATPTYAHAGLVTDAAGNRLAKRDRSLSLAGLRTAGVSAQAVVAELARISGLPETGDLAALAAAFDLARQSSESVALGPGWNQLPE